MAGAAIPGPDREGARRGATLDFVVEAGFYLLPFVVATCAPRGHTPILAETVTHDHLAVVSGMTPQGGLFLQSYERLLTGTEAVRFLEHPERCLPGPVIVLSDGALIHRNRAVKAFLAAGHAARIELVPLPGYAPELNPDELVWSHMKRTGTAKRPLASNEILQERIEADLIRIQNDRALVRSFFKAPDVAYISEG